MCNIYSKIRLAQISRRLESRLECSRQKNKVKELITTTVTSSSTCRPCYHFPPTLLSSPPPHSTPPCPFLYTPLPTTPFPFFPYPFSLYSFLSIFSFHSFYYFQWFHKGVHEFFVVYSGLNFFLFCLHDFCLLL